MTRSRGRRSWGGQRGGIISRLLFLMFLAAFAFVIYLARHPLLRVAGNWWIVSDPLQHADAIIVIGDDNYPADRATHAAELYESGWAPVVVASGRWLRSYSGFAEIIAHDIQSKGVPAGAVVPFAHRAANTREEAEALTGLVAQRHWHKIILVTSSYHTRRARYIFRKVFPADVTVLASPAPDSDYDPSRWWESRLGVKIFFEESVGYPVAMWELRNRQPAASPGLLLDRGFGFVSQPSSPLGFPQATGVPSRAHACPMCNYFQFTIESALYYIHRPGPAC